MRLKMHLNKMDKTKKLKVHHDIVPCTLQTLLLAKDRDASEKKTLPQGKKAATNVELAKENANSTHMNADWLIAEHLSRTFLPKPKPRNTSPAFTFSKNRDTGWDPEEGGSPCLKPQDYKDLKHTLSNGP